MNQAVTFQTEYSGAAVRNYSDGSRATGHRVIEQSPVDGWFEVNVGAYDPDFVDAIKDAIPSRARGWEPSRAVWRVAPRFALVLASLIYPNWPVKVKTSAERDPKGAREFWYEPSNQ